MRCVLFIFLFALTFLSTALRTADAVSVQAFTCGGTGSITSRVTDCQRVLGTGASWEHEDHWWDLVAKHANGSIWQDRESGLVWTYDSVGNWTGDQTEAKQACENSAFLQGLKLGLRLSWRLPSIEETVDGAFRGLDAVTISGGRPLWTASSSAVGDWEYYRKNGQHVIAGAVTKAKQFENNRKNFLRCVAKVRNPSQGDGCGFTGVTRERIADCAAKFPEKKHGDWKLAHWSPSNHSEVWVDPTETFLVSSPSLITNTAASMYGPSANEWCSSNDRGAEFKGQILGGWRLPTGADLWNFSTNQRDLEIALPYLKGKNFLVNEYRESALPPRYRHRTLSAFGQLSGGQVICIRPLEN